MFKLYKNIFYGLNNLKELNLSFNSFTRIPSDSFIYLSNLTNISLNDNQIEYFEFRTLVKLEYLNLNNNKLRYLNSKNQSIFYQMKYLNPND